MTKPESVFEDYLNAMACLCEGCPRETGWLEDWINHDTPQCALAIMANEDVMFRDGNEWKCKERQKIENEEFALYAKRMAGDWS